MSNHLYMAAVVIAAIYLEMSRNSITSPASRIRPEWLTWVSERIAGTAVPLDCDAQSLEIRLLPLIASHPSKFFPEWGYDDN